MTPDVNVILVDFPNGGNEMVVPNEDGSYTLLINARLSYDGQLKLMSMEYDTSKTTTLKKKMYKK